MRSRLVGCCAVLWWACLGPQVHAQGWDEEPADEAPIVDPELAGEPGAQPAPAGPAASAASTASAAPSTPDAPAMSSAPMPAPSTGEVHTMIRSRTGMDLYRFDPRQDIVTSTQLLSIEATVRPKEGTRLVVGLRPVHRFMTRADATSDARAARFELDVLPGPAYADLTLADGVHLRLGYQYLHLGRFDLLSATNVLSASDLRDGPMTFPEAAELSQPAARVDWDPNLWLSLRFVYVPFFQPHVVSLGDGDYALFPSTQAQVDANLDASLGNGANSFRRQLLVSTSRAGQEAIAQSGFEAFSPVADLSRPQAAVRATAHGPAGEAGATVALANERLPAPAFSRAMRTYLDDPTVANEMAVGGSSQAPVEVLYNRFALASVDGATHVGPVQVGAELAYMFGRTFFAAAEGRVAVPQRSDLAQAGLRLEYLRGEHLAVAAEAFVAYALHEPEGDGRQWLMLDGGRFLTGLGGLASWSPADLGLLFELGGGALSGPSYAVLPRVEYTIIAGLAAELGAALLFGPEPPETAGPEFSLAGRYADADQVFVGLRYLP